jgi:hypothetical protein
MALACAVFLLNGGIGESLPAHEGIVLSLIAQGVALLASIFLAGLVGMIWGFPPALIGAAGLLLPLHWLVLGRYSAAPAWYAAAGLGAGAIAGWAAPHLFGYLAYLRWHSGITVGLVPPMLFAGALGGCVGAVLFRNILRP